MYPALAIAELIKINIPEAEIAFVGTERGIENKLVPSAGYPLYHIPIAGIRRSLSPANLKTAYLVATSPKKARKLIRELKPDIVIGTGGYVCWPLLYAASGMGVPTMVHESNALAGLAVRQLQKKVDVILTNFEETKDQLKVSEEKIVHVGNPLRGGYGTCERNEARRKLGIPENTFTILSFGGSLGAQKMNEAAVAVMEQFVARTEHVMHFHSGGSRQYENAKALYEEKGLCEEKGAVLREYIYDMPLYMAAADLIICRAGAMTLTEVAMMKKPAILIPSPNVTDNHQYKNAKVLADAKGAILLEEKDLTDETICQAVRRVAEDQILRAQMSEAISAFAMPNAGRSIYEEITNLLQKKRAKY